MKRISKNFISCLLLTTALLAPGALLASELQTMALGSSSELYHAVAGSYAELYPDGTDLDGATPVLVLSVKTGGDEPVLGIVPGTDDEAVERDPVLLYDRRSTLVTLVWKSDVEAGTHVRFATFDGSEWSEGDMLLEAGEPLAFARDPLMITTRDAFDVELESGEQYGASRNILHLVWQTEDEIPLTRYSSLTFVDGIYNGSNHIFDLSGALLFGIAPPAEGEPAPPEIAMPEGLTRSLTLEAGNDGNSLRVTFASSASGRVGTVHISALPLALEHLGSLVRERIDSLADLYDPEDLSSFSDAFRAGVVIIGSTLGLNPATVDYATHGADSWILENGGEYTFSDFIAFGDDLGEHTLDLASSVNATVTADPSNPDHPIIRIDLSEFLTEPEPETMSSIFKLQVLSARTFPDVGDVASMLDASEDGRNLLVSRPGGDGAFLFWKESRHAIDDGAWSEVQSLELGDGLSVEQGRELLRRHIR